MKVGVTGASGFVGGNIAEVLVNAGHEVFGLSRSENNPAKWSNRHVDFSSVEGIYSRIADLDAVVHCAIANDFNRLEKDLPFSYDSYVGLTSRVTRACNRADAQIVYISTDWVMGGRSAMSDEDNYGSPVNIYGFSKALGEQVVKDLQPDRGAICRIGGVMGRHRTKKESPRNQDVGFGYFVSSVVDSLSAGRNFAVWKGDGTNKFATPSLASEIGAGVERVITLSESGVFHLVSDDRVGRLELAELTADAFSLDSELIYEAPVPEEELFSAPVPVDTSLSNSKTLQRLQMTSLPITQLLRNFSEEYKIGELRPITKPLQSS